MSKKTNTEFLTAFIELETACDSMLGCKRSGVTEYINRLNNFGSIPGKSEILPKLIFYRKIRNKIAHESGALTELRDVDKSDVRWLKNFKRDVEKRRDPISKNERSAFGKKLKLIAILSAVALVLIAVALIIIF